MVTGNQMYDVMKELFPICRSITGNGFRISLKILQKEVPFEIREVPTGEKVFDWEVPKEWNISEAYIEDDSGERIVDFKNNNLHVVNYSIPVDKELSLSELQDYLYSLEDNPDAIPYVTSYYKERWGFCLTHNQRMRLREGTYRAVIKSTLHNGSLTYGELVIPGRKKEEIFISSYLCHPSMANNELSGPIVATFLAKWLLEEKREYTYRIAIVPEIIGSLTYVKKNLSEMKKNIIAGFNLTCVGANDEFSFMPSKEGNTLTDRVARAVLRTRYPNFKEYSFLSRGSDERTYCSPGLSLPVVSIMRTKYGEFKEYHTSLDNLSLIKPETLQGSLDIHKECIEILENNKRYQTVCIGEPQLGKRGLYPSISSETDSATVQDTINILAYCDGKNNILDLIEKLHIPYGKTISLIKKFLHHEIIREVKEGEQY